MRTKQAGSASGGRPGAKKGNKGSVIVYDVPYSEHSSFEELKAFVEWLDPHQIITPALAVGSRDDDSGQASSSERRRQLETMIEWLMTC